MSGVRGEGPRFDQQQTIEQSPSAFCPARQEHFSFCLLLKKIPPAVLQFSSCSGYGPIVMPMERDDACNKTETSEIESAGDLSHFEMDTHAIELSFVILSLCQACHHLKK